MTIIADMHRVRTDQPVVSPDPKLGLAANSLNMFRGERPDEREEEAFAHLLLLHADHGFNASTFGGWNRKVGV